MNGFGNFLKALVSDIGPFGAIKFWKSLFQGKPYIPYSDTFNSAAGNSLWNKVTGEGLTGADQANNEFAAQEAQKNRDFQERMANTAYQRQVADMRAAGVNPALVASGSSGAAVPSGAQASPQPSPNGLNLSDLLQLIMLRPQIKQVKAATAVQNAEADKVAAEAENIRTNTSGRKIENDFLQATFDARKRGIDLANDTSEGNIRKIYKDIDLTEQNIKKAIAETRTESDKQALLKAQELVAKANARQIAELLPYQKALAAAQTSAQKAQAALAMAQTAYQNKMIDDGYLDAMIDQLKSSAHNSEEQAQIMAVKRQLRDGTFGRTETGFAPLDFLNNVGSTLLQSFVLLADNFPKIM